MRRFEVFRRNAANPILRPEAWPYPCNAVFNPGATRGPDGETLLLVRVEDDRGFSHLTVARSKDGVTDWKIDAEPTLLPSPETHPEEAYGIEDPRVTRLDDRDEWAITYTAYSCRGPLVSLATTKDFRSFTRIGPVLAPENKDAALFPKKIGGRYAMLHRPVVGGQANMWIAYSPDLKYWGEHEQVMTGRGGAWWDGNKLGLNCPPLETSEGWLCLYHGVRHHCSGALYRLGVALLDLEDPSKVIGRCQGWILGPKEDYELQGDVPGAIFPCGWVHDDATDLVHIYYGGADNVVAHASAPLTELMQRIERA